MNQPKNNSLSWLVALLVAIVFLVILAVILAFSFINLALPSTAASSNVQATMEDVLGVHKEVLETVKWLVTIFTGLLTASGIASFIYGVRGVDIIQEKVKTTLMDADGIKKEYDSLKAERDKLEEILNATQQKIVELETQFSKILDKLKETQHQLEESQKLLEEKQKRFEGKLNDDPFIQQLQTIYEVNVRAVKLLDEDGQTRELARRALVELTKDKDPVVRRECIRIFSKIRDYPSVVLQEQWIAKRLRKLYVEDDAQSVRLDAKRALIKLGAILDDGDDPSLK